LQIPMGAADGAVRIGASVEKEPPVPFHRQAQPEVDRKPLLVGSGPFAHSTENLAVRRQRGITEGLQGARLTLGG
ncbi:MAG: hypothetical protein ACRD3G_19335, partial [Vicinamibacterales bacterium]